MMGLRLSTPSAASLILSLESVFGVLFSALFYGERMTFRLVLGFSVIFAAVLISEYRPREREVTS
jgi:drug/metabolite transporter (DMT)-like permease